MSVRWDCIGLLSSFSPCACIAHLWEAKAEEVQEEERGRSLGHLGSCSFNQLTSWVLSGLSLREYPDFYQKLYGLLDPSIFHVKYRARFFHLVDLFLSSS